MPKILPILILFLLLALPAQALAHKDSDSGSGKGGEKKIEIKIEAQNEVEEEEAEIKQNEFEVTGTIESMTGGQIVVLGNTINIDPGKVSDFEQKGSLTVGALVKVEGPVIDGALFAHEIKVLQGAAVPAPSLQGAVPNAVQAQPPFKFKLNKNRFKISGPVEATTSSGLQIAGQDITLDPSQVNRFKVKVRGPLDATATARIQGTVDDGTLLAQNIKVGPAPTGSVGVSVLVVLQAILSAVSNFFLNLMP